MDAILQDLRYAVRSLKKQPALTMVATLSLALGVGANAALFSVADAVLFRPLPVAQPEQLVALRHGSRGTAGVGFPYSSFAQLRDGATTLAGLVAYYRLPIDVATGTESELANGQLVSGNYFEVLGIRASVGRLLSAGDDRSPGAHPVAVISHEFWERRFARDSGVVGRVVRINGAPFELVGVTPPGFFGLEVGASPHVTMPLMMQPVVMPGVERLTERTQLNDWLRLVGRLKPGVSRSEALAELEVVYGRVVDELVARFAGEPAASREYLAAQRLTLVSGERGLSELRDQFGGPIRILMGFVGLVLLIACANVAGLLVARSAERRRDIAVRLALGASRSRLMRQLLIESLLLALLGAFGGVLVASWSIPALLTFLPEAATGAHLAAPVNARVLGFTAVVAVLAGIILGIPPAIAATRIALSATLRDGARTMTQSRGARSLGRVLVVVQVALSVLLLMTAGLLARSMQNLTRVDTGFEADGVLVTRLQPAGSDRKTPLLAARYEDLLARLRRIPDVRSASLIAASPVTREGWAILPGGAIVTAPGGEALASGESRIAWLQIFPDAFQVLGIPLIAGRDFGASDVGRFSAGPSDSVPSSTPGSVTAVVINQAMAQRFFGGVNAVGRRLELHGRDGARSPLEVVGVVKDARFTTLRDEAGPMFFMPFSQANTGRGQMTLVVRTTGDLTTAAAAVRREVRLLDPAAPPFAVEPLAAQVNESLARERLVTLLTTLFGALALVLASVGIYGLIASGVARRVTEMGIRIALGAHPGGIRWLVMRDAVLLTSAGVLVGVPAALVASVWLSNLLFGISPADPVTLAAVGAGMLLTAGLASFLPARRASRVDPMVAMRSE